MRGRSLSRLKFADFRDDAGADCIQKFKLTHYRILCSASKQPDYIPAAISEQIQLFVRGRPLRRIRGLLQSPRAGDFVFLAQIVD